MGRVLFFLLLFVLVVTPTTVLSDEAASDVKDKFARLTFEERERLLANLEAAQTRIQTEARMASSENKKRLHSQSKILEAAHEAVANPLAFDFRNAHPAVTLWTWSFRNYPELVCGDGVIGVSRPRDPWPPLLNKVIKEHPASFQPVGALVVNSTGDEIVVGTAIRVGQKYALTAGHVVKQSLVAAQDEFGAWRLVQTSGVKMQFSRQYSPNCTSKQLAVDVVAIHSINPNNLDVAVLELKGDTLPPSVDFVSGATNDVVAVVGYPIKDTRLDDKLQDLIFAAPDGDPHWGTERISGGKVIGDYKSEFFKHDATTVGNNSGSPIVRISDGKIIGLHIGAPDPSPPAGDEDFNLAIKGQNLISIIPAN